jgi:hypothetical protein
VDTQNEYAYPSKSDYTCQAAVQHCDESETVPVCRISLYTRKMPGLRVSKLVFLSVLMEKLVLLRVKHTLSESESMWKS